MAFSGNRSDWAGFRMIVAIATITEVRQKRRVFWDAEDDTGMLCGILSIATIATVDENLVST